MSYIVLCKGNRALKPYEIEDLKLRLYSVEELCYYMYSNTSFCAEELTKKSLAVWLRDQCGLPDLYASLAEVLDKAPLPERVAAHIFAYADFLNKQERDAVCERIKKSSHLDLNERRKSRADLFYLDGKYKEAVTEYGKLLQKKAYDTEKMKGILLYNIGCCYASMFYYRIAVQWFLQAAETEALKKDALLAAVFCMDADGDEKALSDFLAAYPEAKSLAAEAESNRKEAEEMWKQEPETQKMQTMLERSGSRNREYQAYLTEKMDNWKKRL
ncbi:MAG: hypothetical protein J1E61_09115 [Lachnospiraceae bacterium]|nr:hypothetical protein [Lachnospiraceae bacterium]